MTNCPVADWWSALCTKLLVEEMVRLMAPLRRCLRRASLPEPRGRYFGA